MRRKGIFLAILFLAVFSLPGIAQQTGQVPSPEEVLGFPAGADFKLADYKMMLRYFELLDEASDRVVVTRIGTTTEDQPFIMAIISSPENLAQKEHYQDIARRLARVRGLDEGAAKRLATEEKQLSGLTAASMPPKSPQASTPLSWRITWHRIILLRPWRFLIRSSSFCFPAPIPMG